jgi:Mg2+-importing ATPase
MVLVLFITLALPYSPLKGILGFTPLPFSSLMLLGLITAIYAAASELTKRYFFLRVFGQETPS